MAIPNLTRSKIKEHTSGGSFERGQKYLSDGAVRSVKRTDPHTLKAQVQGSDVHPYLVTIKFDDHDIQKVSCTCPYHEGSWCKHIVAVLLKSLKLDDIPVVESDRLKDLVADLGRDELITLLERLIEKNPRVLNEIEEETPRVGE